MPLVWADRLKQGLGLYSATAYSSVDAQMRKRNIPVSIVRLTTDPGFLPVSGRFAILGCWQSGGTGHALYSQSRLGRRISFRTDADADFGQSRAAASTSFTIENPPGQGTWFIP